MATNDLQIRKILIPYDFSETAALSLEHCHIYGETAQS